MYRQTCTESEISVQVCVMLPERFAPQSDPAFFIYPKTPCSSFSGRGF